MYLTFLSRSAQEEGDICFLWNTHVLKGCINIKLLIKVMSHLLTKISYTITNRYSTLTPLATGDRIWCFWKCFCQMTLAGEMDYTVFLLNTWLTCTLAANSASLKPYDAQWNLLQVASDIHDMYSTQVQCWQITTVIIQHPPMFHSFMTDFQDVKFPNNKNWTPEYHSMFNKLPVLRIYINLVYDTLMTPTPKQPC